MNKKVLFILGSLFFQGLSWPDTYVSGDVSGNWDLAGSPYVVTDSVIIASTATLIIEPNVVVKFAANGSLTCYGTLSAVGTLTGTITFTASQTTPSAGFWQSIRFSGSNAKGTISYCDIGYAKSAIYLENASGIVITYNYIHDNKGDDGGFPGGIGCGIYLLNSNNNIIGTNTIKSNKGGEGGRLWYRSGGSGGIGTGIYLYNSTSNTILNNTISNNIGGKGGTGGCYFDPDGYYEDSGGSGGIGTGIYLSNSTLNIISNNTISNNNGGQGGAGGGGSGSGGSGGVGYGIYIESNSFNNTITTSNTYNNESIFYYYNQSGITIENQNLTLNGSGSTNLGRVVLINCSGFTIRNNTISGGIGQNGITGDRHSSGGSGGIGCGIYLYNSTNGTITNNTISNNTGGKGGTGGGRNASGSGGIGYGIYLSNSTNNTISGNTISNNNGGQGGTGGYLGSGGLGGIGCGIYLSNSTLNTILQNTISNNTGGNRGSPGPWGGYGSYGQGYGIYSISNSSSAIHCNNLSGNKSGDLTKGYGVYHDGSSGTISATYNWWGANSGPEHSTNPSGQGDKVSNYVDYFPWLRLVTTPSSGPVGGLVTIYGGQLGTNTIILIDFGTTLTIATTLSSPNGTFSTTFIVDTQPSGTTVITARNVLGDITTNSFFIYFLKIDSVSPKAGHIGIPITIQGKNYMVSKEVQIDFGTTQTIATAITENDGRFLASFVVNTQAIGEVIITARNYLGDQATISWLLTNKKIYVNVANTGLETGSKEHPFNTIAEGIGIALDGYTVWVADGTYTGTGNKDLTWSGKHITVRSENGADNCIIDCQGSGRAFYFNNSGTSDVVQGFTIRNGNASYGGGICCHSSSPAITHCTISGNSASWGGGGIWCYNSSPAITNYIVSGNSASNRGGGIFCDFSSPAITYDDVWNNSAPNGPNYYNCSPGIGCISADPLFVSPNDFHLQPSSPCIDAGSNTAPAIPPTDKDGKPRIINGRVDMGAYEYGHFV
ncbi:MAG: right-handed parallel beta-helix repeat-containing protein [bacterium]